MEHKDQGVASIFIENAYMDGVQLETETDTFLDGAHKEFCKPIYNRYTLSFTTSDGIIFDNPITMHRGNSYEVLILIREKQ